MPIELNTGKLSSAYVDAGTGQAVAAGQPAASQGILGGNSVEVSNAPATDLEKLVANLKNEEQQQRANMAQRRIAILLTVLSAMSNRITEQQRNALVQIGTLNGQIDDLEKSIEDNEKLKEAAEKDAESVSGQIDVEERAVKDAEDLLANLKAELEALQAKLDTATGSDAALLEAKIDTVEKAIERAVKDGEAHRKQVEKLKQQKSEDDAKARQYGNDIDALRQQTDACQALINECEKAIGALTLSEVAAAVRAAAGEVNTAPEKADSTAEQQKAEAKAIANDPLAAIREALDRMDADIMRTIEENQVLKV